MTIDIVPGHGDQILNERNRRGWSRKKLAELSGITEGKIWRMEAKGYWTDQEIAGVKAAFDGVAVDIQAPVRGVQRTPVAPKPVVQVQLPPIDSGIPRDALPVIVWDQYQDPRRPENDDFYLISNSEARTAQRCPRKWWLTYYRRLTPKLESPVGALQIGNRIHRALQYMYVPTGEKPFDPREALEVLIIQDWTQVVGKFKEAGLEISPELHKKFTAEADLERAMISGYVEWVAETGEDAELKIIAAETYVEADITSESSDTHVYELNKPTKLIGKLDVRTQRVRDGVRLFMDHKTVGDFTRPVVTLPINPQMLHYHLLEFLSTREGEERCDGALYNMLRKVKRTAAANPPFFKRVEVRHNPLELENYKTQLLSVIMRIHSMTAALDEGQNHHYVTPPNATRDCTWDCPFFQICPMFNDGSRVEAMIEQYFAKSDPLSYYRDPQMIEKTKERTIEHTVDADSRTGEGGEVNAKHNLTTADSGS